VVDMGTVVNAPGVNGASAEREARAKARAAWALDAGAFALTAALGAWLEIAEPNQKYINPDLLWRYSYPHGENSVPTVVVPLVAFVAPLIAIAALPKKYNPNMRKDRALGGLCAAIGLTWVVTCGIKNIVGGIRPDFVDRCWPDGATQTWISTGACQIAQAITTRYNKGVGRSQVVTRPCRLLDLCTARSISPRGCVLDETTTVARPGTGYGGFASSSRPSSRRRLSA
jgi:hypothetical protein